MTTSTAEVQLQNPTVETAASLRVGKVQRKCESAWLASGVISHRFSQPLVSHRDAAGQIIPIRFEFELGRNLFHGDIHTV